MGRQIKAKGEKHGPVFFAVKEVMNIPEIKTDGALTDIHGKAIHGLFNGREFTEAKARKALENLRLREGKEKGLSPRQQKAVLKFFLDRLVCNIINLFMVLF